MLHIGFIIVWLVVDALISFLCYELWLIYGLTVTLSVISIVALLHFRLFDFDGCLGVKDMKDYWDSRANANVKVPLTLDATFDSGILTSTFESIIGAPGLKMMQENWFILSDTKSTITGFKSRVVGMLLLNGAVCLLILVASGTTAGTPGTAAIFDAHTVEAVAISLVQLTWLVSLPYALYQRNQLHLARIK